MERRTLSKSEAAKVLGISYATLHRMIKAGEIPVIRLRHRVFIPASFVEELLERWRKEVGERR